MARGYKTELTNEIVEAIKRLHEQGTWSKQISKQLKIPYAVVRNILNPKKEKMLITSTLLADIEKEIKELPPKELSSKYNRTLGEMRTLLKGLGWVLSKEWDELKHEDYKEQIQKYIDDNLSFKEIGKKLGLDANKIYYICNKLGIKKKPKIKGFSNTQQTTTSYKDLLKETADSIKNKLRKQLMG